MGCEYEVSVTFHSLSNPNDTLASGRTCDGNSGSTPPPPPTCDTYVSFCLKPVTEPSMNTVTDLPDVCGSESNVTSTRIGALRETDNVTFNDTVFGLPNPVSLFRSPPEVKKAVQKGIRNTIGRKSYS